MNIKRDLLELLADKSSLFIDATNTSHPIFWNFNKSSIRRKATNKVKLKLGEIMKIQICQGKQTTQTDMSCRNLYRVLKITHKNLSKTLATGF